MAMGIDTPVTAKTGLFDEIEVIVSSPVPVLRSVMGSVRLWLMITSPKVSCVGSSDRRPLVWELPVPVPRRLITALTEAWSVFNVRVDVATPPTVGANWMSMGAPDSGEIWKGRRGEMRRNCALLKFAPVMLMARVVMLRMMICCVRDCPLATVPKSITSRGTSSDGLTPEQATGTEICGRAGSLVEAVRVPVT